MTTTTRGAGAQPAGASPAGYGAPGQARGTFGAMLRMPADGTVSSARLIDPVTRDYVLDDYTGRLVGMNPVHQQVQLAVHTELRSAAVREIGQSLRSLDRITTSFARRCQSTLETALARLRDRGLIEVLGFTAFRAGRPDGLREGQTYGRLRWRDLTTGQEHDEVI